MKNLRDFLKSCSKDEDSYKQLTEFVESITAEKEQIENQLELLEGAIRSDYDSILITTLDVEKPGPEIVYVNDGFTRMTGYSKEEVLGKTPRILQGPKTERKVLDTLKKRLEEGQAFFGHTVNYRKDGTEFINQWDIHPLTNEEGEITHWVAYQHDITERKRSEKKIVDSRIEFDHLMEESKKTVADIDEQGFIISSNKAFRNLTGYENEELKKLKIWKLFSDEQAERFRQRFEKFHSGDFDGAEYELKIKNSKGNAVEVKMKTRLLKTDGQMVVRASFENTSLQKRISAMLNKRNKAFRKMFDTLKDFRYKLEQNENDEFVFTYVSETFPLITGISEDTAEGMPVRNLVHRDDVEKVEAHFNNVLNGKPDTEQYRIKRKEGGYSEIIDYAKPVWNAESTIVAGIKGFTSIEISSAGKVTKQ